VLGTPGPADTAAPVSPELAPDGRRVALVRIVQGNVDVWLMDVARGVQSRFTSNPAIEVTPLWSPDSRRVVFTSTRNGGADLFEKPTDGVGDEQPLLVTTEGKWPLSWSPDGRLLLYANKNEKAVPQDTLRALPLTGDRKPFPVVQTNFDVTEGQFSPDGHWVAYASNASGRLEISVRPFPGPGETVQVSTAGGSQVRWRRDGHELYYLAPDARLMAVPIAPGKDGQTLEVGAAVPLFPTRLATGGNVLGVKPQYAVAPDGRFLLNVRADEDTAPPITVVLNWQAGLKK
jgi:dipeptidyl aminopeptidase/acylaminoacyl peptidase